MRNKLKIAAAVVVLVVGMAIYKDQYEKREEASRQKKAKAERDDRRRWN